MLNTEDVAYLVALVEKSPSVYPRRALIIEHLQAAWRNSSNSGQPWHQPVAIGQITVHAILSDTTEAPR